MTLSASSMASAAFSALCEEYTGLAAVYRKNLEADPIVPKHRPVEELLGLICQAFVTELTGLGVVGSGEGAYTGPGAIVPAPATFAAGALTAAKTAVQNELDWNRPEGGVYLDTLVGPVLSTITGSLSFVWVPPSSTTAGANGDLTIEMAEDVTDDLVEDIKDTFETLAIADGRFFMSDNPAYGIADTLPAFVGGLALGVKTYIDELDTTTVVQTGGTSGTTTMAAVGSLA